MIDTAKNTSVQDPVRIATRRSPLAMWQAEFIRDALIELHPGLAVELLPMTTRGDKILDAPLAKVGGKGLFVKELEAAMLENRADFAVHSTKDVPMELPAGLELGVICQRANPLDALVLPQGSTLNPQLAALPQGATVGTSSLRRQCQLRVQRPDLRFIDLRGNVNSRLAKLDSGEYDAIVLAAAGLERLGLSARISSLLEPEVLLPAVGQGALSIEYRDNDERIRALLAPLHDAETATCVLAERAMNRHLNGGCQVPIAGFARWQQDEMQLEGRVGAVAGDQLLSASASGNDPETLGKTVGEDLLSQGAGELLAEAYR